MKPSHAGAGALCLLLGGCGKMGLDPNEDTAPAAELRVDALDPDWGPTSGGNQVAISGAGFVGAVGVSFGNAELAVPVPIGWREGGNAFRQGPSRAEDASTIAPFLISKDRRPSRAFDEVEISVPIEVTPAQSM